MKCEHCSAEMVKGKISSRYAGRLTQSLNTLSFKPEGEQERLIVESDGNGYYCTECNIVYGQLKEVKNLN